MNKTKKTKMNYVKIQTFSTDVDEIFDKVVIFKLFNNPKVFENLKLITETEIFSSLKELCFEKLKVNCN